MTTLHPRSLYAYLFALMLFCTSAVLAQTRAELVLQTGHSKSVIAIALSPDGRFLASGSSDQTIKIWDTVNGSVLRTLIGHAKPVLAVAVSPDGRWIVSGSADASVRLWDVLTGESRVVGNHSGPVKDLAFSPDGRQLTSLGNNEVKLWDVTAGREIRSVKLGDDKNPQGGPIATAGEPMEFDQTATALSADGRFAAIGGGIYYKSGFMGYGGGVRSKPIKLIEIATGREITSLKLKGDMPNPTDLAFSPDGRLLVAKFTETNAAREKSGKTSVIVWEVATGREVKIFQTGDQYGTGGIAFSPDGKLLASRASKLNDSDVKDNTTLKDLGSGYITFFNVATWNQVRELKNTGIEFNIAIGFTATPLRFSPDGRVLAASLSQGVALYDTATGNRLRVLRTTEKASAVSAAPGASAQDELMRQQGIDPEQLRQAREMAGGIMDNLPQMSGMAMGRTATGSLINFSPDGRLLTSMGSSTTWDVVAGTPYQRPQPQNAEEAATMNPIDQSLFSPDSKLTASIYRGDGGSGVVIKDATTHRILRKIPIGKQVQIAPGAQNQKEFPSQISSIAFNARGVIVQYCDFKIPGSSSMLLGAFGGGGSTMDCHVALFDINTGQQLREIKLDKDNTSLFGNLTSLSPDGRFIISVAMDAGSSFSGLKPSLPSFGGLGRGGKVEMPKQQYKIRLTDLENGRKLWEIKAEGEMTGPPSFIFSPTGERLAVAGSEKNRQIVSLHDTASGRKVGALSTSGKKIATMNFSRDGKMLATTYADENSVTIWDAATGQQSRTLAHATTVSGVAFHPVRKLIATQGKDRNQYLWDLESGERLATLVNLDVLNEYGNDAEWLVVTPDGLFDGSPAAWQQIMWRFSQNTFDVGPVEIFFNELYHPGLLEEVFSGKRPKAPRDLQQLDRRQPGVKVGAGSTVSGEITTRTLTVKVEVVEAAADSKHPQGSGVRDVRLFRNGTLVKVWRGDVLNGQKQAILEATLPIVAGENRITAYAFNRDNVKSQDAVLTVTGSASLQRKGTAWVLAFGVNQYANAQYNLKYAVADATSFADEVKAQQLKLQGFERVELIQLLDAQATKANFLLALKRLAGGPSSTTAANVPEALSKLKPAQPEDAVLIYFAGHGTAQGARFYLVPHDLGYNGSRTALTGEAVKTILEHSISDLELESAVESLDAGHLLMVIDACNSGQALEAEEKRRGPMNSKGLAQLAYEKGMSILTAAQSFQAALEAAQLGHGYLTFALVEEGLKKGMADRDRKDGQVLVREWFNYAEERVPLMQEQNLGSRILLEEEKAKDPATARSVQRPRVFYRRESEARPLIVAKP
ncbi:MAG: caspase family protein [Acidobacteria bacterium]|nr:caspase family protein [Acidobacteriota bacterium]